MHEKYLHLIWQVKFISFIWFPRSTLTKPHSCQWTTAVLTFWVQKLRYYAILTKTFHLSLCCCRLSDILRHQVTWVTDSWCASIMPIAMNCNQANLRDLTAATGLAILLKLDSNRQFCSPCDLEIWWMSPKNNRAPLLCYFKLFASFRSHWWMKTGVTVRKRPIWVKFDDF